MYNFEQRRELLREKMHREGISTLLVTHAANRFYLSGFELEDSQCNESSGCLIIRAGGQDILCTDSRYEEAAAALWPRENVFVYKGSGAEDIRALLKESPGPVGFESKVLNVDLFRQLEPGLDLRPADGLVEELRVIKDENEIRRLRDSAALNHKLMDWLPTQLVAGATEGDIAWAIERFFRENGASGNSFSPIVARNQHAALPHYRPEQGNAAITTNCHVLIDVGARLNHYCSDQTRTFWVGDKPEPRFLETLALVREAQSRAIAAVRPGVSGKDVYHVAKSTFAAKGLDNAFTHALGHGVGLETHEEPRLSPRSVTILEPGMVVTVEPGLYFPDWGGIRWEHMVLVTPSGCQVL